MLAPVLWGILDRKVKIIVTGLCFARFFNYFSHIKNFFYLCSPYQRLFGARSSPYSR